MGWIDTKRPPTFSVDGLDNDMDFQTLRWEWVASAGGFRCKVRWDSCCGSAREALPCTERSDAKQPGHLAVRAVCLAERTYSCQESIEVRPSVRMDFYIPSGLRQRSPKEGHDLCSCAVSIRTERGRARALGDVILDRPQHRACVRKWSVTAWKRC